MFWLRNKKNNLENALLTKCLKKHEILRLTLLYTNEFFHLFDTMKLVWFIVTIRGSQVKISKLNLLLSWKVVFNLTNSADPDEMHHSAAFHMGLH